MIIIIKSQKTYYKYIIINTGFGIPDPSASLSINRKRNLFATFDHSNWRGFQKDFGDFDIIFLGRRN